MKVKCLGSGSDGNCYVLTDNNGKMLLIDVGLSIKVIKQGINFNVSDIVGAIIDHAHSDHSKSVDDLKKMGKQVFTPYTRKDDAKRVRTNCGDFVVDAFLLDSADGEWLHTNGDGSPCKCYGFYIRHNIETDFNLLYITDCEYCRYTFTDIKNVIIGTNYSLDRLNTDTNESRKYHVMTGHMSIENACDMLKANSPSNSVVLAHLSLANADANEFKAKAEEVVNCPVYVAQTGLEIEL